MPSRWPRCMHARLVEKLVDADARVIAFDVLFRERPPLPGAEGNLNAWQDESLATAFAASARVVLAQKLEILNGHETLSEIGAPIAAAALGAGPFPLNVDEGRVDRFPTFHHSTFLTPTLPTIALQAYTRGTNRLFTELLNQRTHTLVDVLPASDDPPLSGQLAANGLLIHYAFRSDPLLGPAMVDALQTQRSHDAETRMQLLALVSLFKGDDARLLNFYGPSGTIPAIGYDQVLASTPQQLSSLFKDRAVFVGYLEEDQPEQTEHFATVFSSATTADLSGVEVAATAFANRARQDAALAPVANIAADDAVERTPHDCRMHPPPQLLRYCRHCDRRRVVRWRRALCIRHEGNLDSVRHSDVHRRTGGRIHDFVWKYTTTRRQRKELRRAFAYFVPEDVVRTPEQNAKEIGHVKESIECACVATDAANFTPLAESMAPDALADFLNSYFEALFRGVAAQGGFVSDVVGDAMLAIWPHRSSDTHIRLLRALIQMRDAAQQFDEQLAGN